MKKTKCKKMRKIRIVAIMVLLFRYGSEFLKEGEFHICETIYSFIIKYVYEGIPGIVLQPICEGLWSWEYYPLVYFFAGIPMFLLLLLLTFLIRFKEHTKIVGPEEPGGYDYENKWNSKGVYKTACPPIYRRIWYWMKEKLINCSTSIEEQLSESAVLSIIVAIGTNHIETQENMAMVQEWTPKDLSFFKTYYDEKNDTITIFADNKPFKVLSRGDSITNEDMSICFLQ